MDRGAWQATVDEVAKRHDLATKAQQQHELQIINKHKEELKRAPGPFLPRV